VAPIETREIYAAPDWLGERQERVEKRLARKHLSEGTLVLYDVSSSYLEGRRCCELAQFGYSRDKRGDRPQIVYGLICDRHGCPIAIEAFSGEIGDPSTLSAQVEKLKGRFGMQRVALVGDRGMITEARIAWDLKLAGLDWITALRAPQIQALVAEGQLQLELFDERDLAEITAPAFPGERLVVCGNAALVAERARKREELLAATERAPSRASPRRPGSSAVPWAARPRSASKSVPASTSTRWPSTSRSPSPRSASPPGAAKRGDPSRGPARRPLRHPRQPAPGGHGWRGPGQKLKVLGPGRACLPLHEVPRPADPAGLSLA
jgi:hypothetical protein